MSIEHMSLGRQMDIVFRQLKDELSQTTSGTVFVHIRGRSVGKFGMRHHPIEVREGKMSGEKPGLTGPQILLFRNTAIESLKRIRNWTHGEIQFDFTVRQNMLFTSVQLESNYNMAALVHPSSRLKFE